MYDVTVVGGSYAGLAAALQLARARRRVLVIDAGERRNQPASGAHGFLGQDGVPPGEIAAKGRAEVVAYPTVEWQDARAHAARKGANGFVVTTDTHEYRSKRLILATGVSDDLPAIPGLSERWGRSVFHCPYCHGYELERGRIGVLATNELSKHFVVLAAEWGGPGQTTYFVDDAVSISDDERAHFEAKGIRLERERVVSIAGEQPRVEVQLRGDRVIELDGLFVGTSMRIKSPFVEQLGLELEAGPAGSFYKTDVMTKETSLPGVFACGDAALAMGSVSFAVADGARAGIGAHRSLVFSAA